MTKRKKKLRLDDPIVAETLINKQLEKFGYNIETIPVDDNHMVNGIMWYDYFTFTKKEEEEYIEWAWNFFKENVSPKTSRKNFDKIMGFFLLSHGLKVIDDE